MYTGHGRLASVCLSVCVSVCLSVPCRIPALLHGPGCKLGVGPMVGVPSSCAQLSGFAIGERVSLHDNIHVCRLIALLQMRIPLNAKYQRVLVLAQWLVD